MTLVNRSPNGSVMVASRKKELMSQDRREGPQPTLSIREKTQNMATYYTHDLIKDRSSDIL